MMQSPEKQPKKKGKMWLNLAYIAAIAGVMAYLLLRDESLTNVAEAMRTLDSAWLALAVVCSLGFLLIEGWAMFFTIRWLCPGSRIGYFHALRTALIGQFYSAITPSSTGGQPMQVLDMYQQGLSVGHGTSVVMIRFVTHQTAIFLFTFFGFVTQYSFIKSAMASFIPLGILGIVLSMGCVALVIAATVSTHMTHALFSWFVRTLTRLHLCRSPEKLQNQLNDVLSDFHEAGAYLRSHIGHMFVLTAFDVLFYALLYSVTYCLYRAFGLHVHSYLKIVLLQAFMWSTIYFFPLPGASGASEGGFLLLFRRVFTPKFVFSSMLLWRVLTYYNKIIVGAIGVVAGALEKSRHGERSPETPEPDAQA